MKVYVLEIFWGSDWETVGVYSTEEAATQAGELEKTHSADYVRYYVGCFEVKQ